MRLPLFVYALVAGPACASPYLDAVVEHAGRFLEHGRDRYGEKHTPLFVDGLDVRSLQPAEWVYGGASSGEGQAFRNKIARRWQRAGERWVLCDLANQGDFFRVLDGLTELTGDPRYRGEAGRALAYGMRHLRSRSGLIYWGGHLAYDLRGDTVVTEQGEHELKCHYPHYPLMAEVDRRRTLRFVESFWNAHVRSWRSLDMNRHGDEFFWRPPPLRMWRQRYDPPPVPFRGTGRAFCNTASDMMAAAVFSYQNGGDRRTLSWARRLGARFADARHPETGLGGYQYTTTGDDRARAQFGPEFGAIASDASILAPYMSILRYGRMPIVYLILSDQLGREEGAEFQRWAVEDLLAFGEHVYRPADNMIHPMFIDGRRIELSEVKRAGHYYDPAVPRRTLKLHPHPAGGVFFWACAMAYRSSGAGELLPTLGLIGKAHGLGDVMAAPSLAHGSSDPDLLHGLLELHRATGEGRHLALAKRLGDNILRDRRHNGFLVASGRHRYTRCSTPEALALLHLHLALTGSDKDLPRAWPSDPFFQARYADRGRTTDRKAIYHAKVRP